MHLVWWNCYPKWLPMISAEGSGVSVLLFVCFVFVVCCVCLFCVCFVVVFCLSLIFGQRWGERYWRADRHDYCFSCHLDTNVFLPACILHTIMNKLHFKKRLTEMWYPWMYQIGEGKFFATPLGAECQILNSLPVMEGNVRLSAAAIGPSQRRNKIIYKTLMTTEIP